LGGSKEGTADEPLLTWVLQQFDPRQGVAEIVPDHRWKVSGARIHKVYSGAPHPFIEPYGF
jgi:hypothetical protein